MNLARVHRQSLRWRLPLLIAVLLVVVLATFLWLADREVEKNLLRAGGARASGAATQLASLFQQSAQQRLTEARRLAEDAAVARLLQDPTDEHRRAALDHLRSRATTGRQIIEVWSTRGSRVLALASPPSVEQELPAGMPPSSPGIGPFQTARGVVFADTVAEITSPAREGTEPGASDRLGSLVVRRPTSTTPTPDALNRLIGGSAHVLVGNARGGVWTDLLKVVAAPPVDLAREGPAQYIGRDGRWQIGGLAPVGGTPWAVWVEIPRDATLAPARAFLGRMIVITGLLAAFATALTRFITNRITAPLTALTGAAEAIAKGDYSRRVTATRRDEIGRLGDAFNTMTAQVESAHARLEARARELAAEVTERRRMETALRDRERDFRALFADSPVPMWVYDLTTLQFLEVNDAAIQRYGYSRDEFLAMNLTDIRPPEDVPVLLSNLNQPRHDCEHSGTWRHRLKSGRIIDVEIASHTLVFENRHAAMVLAYDVTERRQVERALLESEARKTAVMNGALDSIITMDHEGIVTEFNPAAEQTFGYARDEAVGRPLADLVIPVAMRERHREGLTRYLATGQGPVIGKRLELPALRKNGTEFPAELSIIAIQAEGPPIFTGFVRDLTEQKRAEAARLRSVQLEEENRRVQHANRLKSEFLANMSHELRTPLNAIIGFAELLYDGVVRPETPQFREFMHDILTSGQHLLQLINDVLDLSKVEAGRLEFRPEPVDLDNVVGEVLGILRTAAAQKRIAVERRVADVSEVIIDRGRFKQVLYNYVSNALKFTPEHGRVTITIVPGTEDTFRLEVADTGIGIAEENIGKLFVEFQQLDAGAGKTHQGTGLGLALTRRLVEAQGGSVGVRSKLGGGSAFYAELPRRAAAAHILQPRSFAASHTGAPAILVVEDEARDQEVIVRTLVEAGYSVETATTGSQAVAKIRQQTFDAITLDLLLPDVSGIEILKRIRSEGKNLDVPVIVITIVTETGVINGFAVHDVISKPLRGDELLRSLTRAGVVADKTGSVLVVDDDAGSLRLMSATLQQLGYAATCVQRAEDGLRLAAAAPPLAVVLDLVMPELNGFQFLERFRQLPRCSRVPVIIWTVKDLSRDEILTLQSSAQGIVTKGQDGTSALVRELRQVLRPEAVA